MSPRRPPSKSRPEPGFPDLDAQPVVDSPLCLFSLLGTVYELRFHPRPDHRSPFSVMTTGTTAERQRYYLRLLERRKLLEAVHGDDETQPTPFDDLCFRLVHVGEMLPRFVIDDHTVTGTPNDSTKWCTCARVRGLHPVFFCRRIVVPNWTAYWCWRAEEAAPLLTSDSNGRLTTPERAAAPGQSAIEDAKGAYPPRSPMMRRGIHSPVRDGHPEDGPDARTSSRRRG